MTLRVKGIIAFTIIVLPRPDIMILQIILLPVG